MRIAIFGTGGVGGYFGGRLAQAGEDVTFIARGEHLRALREHGLRVDSIKGDFVIQPAQATDDPAEVGPVDAVVVAVKAWDVPEAAQRMRLMVGPDTFVVPLENGVEAPDQLAAVLGVERVLGGLCRLISAIVAPGHIRHSGSEPSIAFGEFDRSSSERVERLRQAFAKAQGVKVEVPPDIQVALWDKFLFIASISGVGAVTRAPADIMRSIPATRRLLEQAMREVLALAQARGVQLTEEAVARNMGFIDSLPVGGTASMQRDIIAGRPSELEYQNGTIVRMGQQLGIPTPVHAYLYASLLPQEQRARGQAEFSL
jgi:2-dehydropantoate 2-reductase